MNSNSLSEAQREMPARKQKNEVNFASDLLVEFPHAVSVEEDLRESENPLNGYQSGAAAAAAPANVRAT